MGHKLFQYRLCPQSRSVRLALGELGIEPELEDHNPWDFGQGLLAKNPAGELPVLEWENGLVLCGSYAISEFLTDARDAIAQAPRGAASGAQPNAGRRAFNLIPGSAEDRAECRRIIDWMHGKLAREVTNELVFEKVHKRLRHEGGSAPDANILRIARANLKYHLSYIGYLADTRRWLAGDDQSFADMAAAAQISVIDYLGEIHWPDAPSVKGWYQRMKSRPSFRALLTDRVPGTPPAACYADLDF